MICKKTVGVEGRRAVLDVGDRLVDLESLSNSDATRWAEVVMLQTIKVGAE